MKKWFVCLANSKKYGERCIAGIAARQAADGRYYPELSAAGGPVWVRPVTTDEHGAIPEAIAKNIALFDVVEIDGAAHAPQGYQSENWTFRKHSLRTVGHVSPAHERMDALCQPEGPVLFGNTGSAIPAAHIAGQRSSLCLICVDGAVAYVREWLGKMFYRLRFQFHDAPYDLPLTDVALLKTLQGTKAGIDHGRAIGPGPAGRLFLTISVGIAFEGNYYKLAAGVMPV